MTAILNRVEDPRDQLERARRIELVAYAKANNVPGITGDMPAILIRRRLRERNLTRPPIPNRQLGVPDNLGPGHAIGGDKDSGGLLANAEDDLERQFSQPQVSLAPAPSQNDLEAPPPDVVDRMTINELGAEMKRLGIHRERRDNMILMREKIKAHG